MTTASKTQTRPDAADIKEQHIAAVLEQRFGNKSMYVPRNLAPAILNKAVDLGFIDASGLLTRKGRALLARYIQP
ncbi:MAG: hypothetical protein MI673_07055 [Thiotrichales bacterium]|nr:hypothetical protein [Thiotrichales bacterium]